MHLAPGLVPVFTPVTEPLFNETQARKTRERLSLLEQDGITVLRAMGQVALDAQADRDSWEEANLRAMGISPELMSTGLDDYVRFAGRPDMVAAFINWFGRYAADLPDHPSDVFIFNHKGGLQEQELMSDDQQNIIERQRLYTPGSAVKGYTLTLGTASQMGVYELSRPLDLAVGKALGQLQYSRYGYTVTRHPYNDAPRKHNIGLLHVDGEPLQTQDGAMILHMVRERGAADIDDKHIVKRFDSLVAIRSLGLMRDIMQLLATSEGRLVSWKESADVDEFVALYESAIHTHRDLRANKVFATAPISTSYLVRDPKK